MNLEKYLKMIIFLIIIGLIYSYFFIPSPNKSINFYGNSESYDIEGQNSHIYFKADSIYLKQNITVFRYVRNISVENWNGEIYSINNSYSYFNSHIQLNSRGNSYLFLDNVYGRISLDSFAIIKSNNQIHIEGFPVENYHNIMRAKGKIYITNNDVNSISINGEEIKDFKMISFEMDEIISYIQLSDGKTTIEGYDVSDSSIRGQISKYFSLGRSEGLLTLDEHSYNIQNSETVGIILDSKNPSDCEIQDTKIIFSGKAYSAKLNGNDLIKSKISYWFDQEPEKLNVLAALILAIITGLYAYTTKGILEQTKTGKRFDNNEKLLMYIYSPMDVILTKFKLKLEYKSHEKPNEIPNEYNSLFQEMNDDLLEIKRNYGYLFDNDIIQLHNEIWRLWEQYLNFDYSEKKKIYDTLNSRINGLHNLISNKIENAKENRNEIIQNL